jgi:hypothetical protein
MNADKIGSAKACRIGLQEGGEFLECGCLPAMSLFEAAGIGLSFKTEGRRKREDTEL